jgi:AcrR family transcriptional regulator
MHVVQDGVPFLGEHPEQQFVLNADARVGAMLPQTAFLRDADASGNCSGRGVAPCAADAHLAQAEVCKEVGEPVTNRFRHQASPAEGRREPVADVAAGGGHLQVMQGEAPGEHSVAEQPHGRASGAQRVLVVEHLRRDPGLGVGSVLVSDLGPREPGQQRRAMGLHGGEHRVDVVHHEAAQHQTRWRRVAKNSCGGDQGIDPPDRGSVAHAARLSCEYGFTLWGHVVYRETKAGMARRQDARQQLLVAARSLLREGGFAALQVAAVAERAGMAIGSVYRHFEGKAALCVEVFEEGSQREVDRLATQVSGGTVASLREAIIDWCKRAQAGRVQAWALLGEPVGPEVEAARLRYRRRYADVLQGALERLMASGELPPQDARVAASGVVGALGESVLGPHGDPDPDAVASFCLRALGAEVLHVDP